MPPSPPVLPAPSPRPPRPARGAPPQPPELALDTDEKSPMTTPTHRETPYPLDRHLGTLEHRFPTPDPALSSAEDLIGFEFEAPPWSTAPRAEPLRASSPLVAFARDLWRRALPSVSP